MLEELIRMGVAAAKASGRRGWVLIRLGDMSVVGAFEGPDKAKKAAKSPGLYLLTEIS
jgi:hypothetical protein